MRAMSRVFDAIARALGIHPSLRQEPLRRAQHQAEPASRRFYLVEWGRHIDIAPDGIGGYLATSPEVPEFASAGETFEQALLGAHDGMATAAELYESDGRDMPMADMPDRRATIIYLGAP